MKRISQHISLFAVSVFTLGIVAVVPVSANNGPNHEERVKTTAIEDDSVSSSDSSGSGRDGQKVRSMDDDSVSTTSVELRSESSSGEDKPTTRPAELRERAQKLLASERQDKKVKSAEARKKSCEARQASLVKKGQNYSRHADRHLEVFDSIYTKVQAFQIEKQLNVSNYDTLKAAVDAKRTTAETAVKTLTDFDVAIDCAADDPAAAVATLKTTVANARKALHEYRVAIKDMVVALHTAAEAVEDSGSESTDSTDATEAN